MLHKPFFMPSLICLLAMAPAFASLFPSVQQWPRELAELSNLHTFNWQFTEVDASSEPQQELK